MSFPREFKYNIVGVDEGSIKELGHQNINSPYKDTIHAIEYYKWIATQAPIEELRAFADDKYITDEYPLLMKRYDLLFLQVYSLAHNVLEEEIEPLIKTAEDSFFSGLGQKISINGLVNYAIAKAEVRAFKELPESYIQELKYFWLYQEDLMEIYRSLGFKDIIAEVYDIKGYRWFCEEAWNDPVRYQWALNALLAKKNCSREDEFEKLREDLFNLYEGILLSAANFKDNYEINKVLKPIRQSLAQWDNNKIEAAITELNKLKNEKKQLKDNYENIKDQYNNLQNQVRNLQTGDKSDEDKINEIIFRIYCLTKPNIKDQKFGAMFKNIWFKLSDESKRDIYSSITLFNNVEAVDLALLPLIRSLEREFSNNYFSPFVISKWYKKCSNYNCFNKKYEVTHKALLAGQHPTMGNIPFIGTAVNDPDAIEASQVIKAFGEFLGKNKKAFIDICEKLRKYRIGVKKYRLVDIRNGIAHGNDKVTKYIDKKSFEEISRMFYEPPIQIMFKVIENSMK